MPVNRSNFKKQTKVQVLSEDDEDDFATVAAGKRLKAASGKVRIVKKYSDLGSKIYKFK